MTSPLPLPDWVPWWVHLPILVVTLLFAMLFLLMPFAVFGVKPRLDLLEARLDEIQGEIRSLSLRLPEPDRDDDFGPDPASVPAPRDYAGERRAGERMVAERPPSQRPPIPPAPRDRASAPGTSRNEPRLY